MIEKIILTIIKYIKYKFNLKYLAKNTNEKIVYQPQVYELAYQLAEKINAKYIIDIGAGNGYKLKPFKEKYKVIIIDYGKNIQYIKSNNPEFIIISHNLEDGLPKISNKILKKSIVICSNVIEHLLAPEKILKDLSNISLKSLFLLISTPDRVKARGPESCGPLENTCHARKWSMDELQRLFKKYKFNDFLIGYTNNSDVHQWKNTILVISGTYAISKTTSNNLKILAIITLYNEIDIIENTITYLLAQGISVHIIDNWSTDGSYEVIKKNSNNNTNLSYERYPKSKANTLYNWNNLLKQVEKVSHKKNFDWYIHHDSDEIRCSPWEDLSLINAISQVDYLGFNAIDHTVIDFRPTEDGYDRSKNPESFFTHFEFGKRPGHFLQIKAWKNTGQTINLHSSGGHEVIFDNRKIFPLKFLLKHYPLRSSKQAKTKIFQNRLPRISIADKKRGWHTQYNKYNENSKYIWSRKELLTFSPTFYNEYLVERLTGIGII